MNSKILLIAIILAVTVSCKKDPQLCTPGFRLDEFEQNLIDALEGNTMGYGFIISENGKGVREQFSGNGRTNTDGQKSFNVDQRMQVASVSKMITTLATLHVLDLKGVDVNSSVEPYLPSGWVRGTGINNLKFIELISQTSGLNNVGTQSFNATKYDSLQAYIASGATLPKNRSYSNTNHGMLRVILPRLWDKYRPAAGSGGYDEDFCSSVYKKCVKELILDPLNITTPDLIPPGNNPNLAYSGSGDNGNGAGGTSDFTNVSGGIGWNMTITQLAKLFAFAFFSDDIIDDNDKQLMKDNRAGLWNTTLDAKYGDYYCKLGAWNYGGGRLFNSVVVLFPNDVQVVIIVNSPIVNNPNNSLRVIANTAFDDSYGC